MNFARHFLASTVLVWLLAGCGGNSTETTLIVNGNSSGSGEASASVDTPVGPNTTEIVVDSGPASGFSLGTANIPYVTVTVCEPGSATACVTVDHVILDTGSIGLRLLKSTVAALALPAVALPADAASGTPAGVALECYPFVLGGLWGPLASADVHIGGERAGALPIQLIDDGRPAAVAAPADCIAASDGGLLDSMSSLQAKGVLGVGMLAYDCGLNCIAGNYSGVGYTLYYSCAGTACAPAAIAAGLQVQNPVVHFDANADGTVDNNGTIIHLPALPDLGVGVAKGRLVFGIGTQTNNQISPTATLLAVETDPANVNYLNLSTTLGASTYSASYIDSGSNALFFDDASIPGACQSTGGLSKGGWYCPGALLQKMATIRDPSGAAGQVDFRIANADALFSTSSLAFADLGGAFNQGANTFVWGLPFFYGRSVYTSIWGQPLSPNGPWNAF